MDAHHSTTQRARIARAGTWVIWYGDKLYVVEEGGLVEVPPIGERPTLISQYQTTLGFPGGTRLYQYLRGRYYWQGMQSMV